MTTLFDEARLTEEERAAWHSAELAGQFGALADAATAKAIRVVLEHVRSVAVSETTPKPENTGDIYRVEGYRGMLAPHYGWVYKDSHLDALEGSWCWWIEMDDGDLYPWMDGEEMPRMDASRVELVRRNPLPDVLGGDPIVQD